MRTYKHDFKDGHGKVNAHKHKNGGGWVANTAHVDETVFISKNAQVYGNARVYNNTRVFGNAWVSGDARITHRLFTARGVGNDNSILTVHLDAVIGIRVTRGCFSGTVKEFLDAVKQKPSDDLWRDIYPELLYGIVYALVVEAENNPVDDVPMKLVRAAQRLTLK